MAPSEYKKKAPKKQTFQDQFGSKKTSSKNKLKKVLQIEDQAKYTCGKCHQTFNSERSLGIHCYLLHLQEHICSTCSKPIRNFKDTIEHGNSNCYPLTATKITHHPPCLHYTLNFSEKELHISKDLIDTHQCTFCNLCFAWYLKLKPDKENNVPCWLCEDKFRNDNEVLEHIKNSTNPPHQKYNNGLAPFICRYCGIAFYNIKDFKNHERVHHNNDAVKQLFDRVSQF